MTDRIRLLSRTIMPMPRLRRPELHCRALATHTIANACLAAALRRRFMHVLSVTQEVLAAVRSVNLRNVRLATLTLRTARSSLRICLRLWRLEIEDVADLLATLATLQTAYADQQNRMAVKYFRMKQWTKKALLNIYEGLDRSDKANEDFSAQCGVLMREIMAKKEWGQHLVIKQLELKLEKSERDRKLKIDRFGDAVRKLQLEKKELRSTLVQETGRAKSLENEKLQRKQAHDLLAAKLKHAQTENRSLHDAIECVVCMQHAATAIFTPCGHRLCENCSARFTVCPHCRAHIQDKFPTKSKAAPPSPSAAAAGRKHQIF